MLLSYAPGKLLKEHFIAELLWNVAGPFNSIQAHEKPECDPPIITIFFIFCSLILCIIDLNVSLLKKLSPNTTRSFLNSIAGNQL